MIRKRNLRNRISSRNSIYRISSRNSNRRLYESIMRDVAKTVKRHLNENENSICSITYAEDSTDGYIIGSNMGTFNNEKAAINWFYDLCDTPDYPQTLYDYISYTEYRVVTPDEIEEPEDLDDIRSEYKLIKNPKHKNVCIGIKYNADLPDPYNEGYDCEGCYILEEGEVSHDEDDEYEEEEW